MKRPILTSFVIMLLFFTTCLIGLYSGVQTVKAEPKTWIVDDDGPADFHTIQEAINDAEEMDTVYVHSGTYSENVILNKTISLVGENRDSTIIDGNDTGNAISVMVNGVIIHGFTIQNSGPSDPDSGIFTLSSENNISNNIIRNNTNGIYLNHSINNIISNNGICSNNWYGIYLHYSDDNTISDNEVYSNYNDAISLYYSDNNTISANNVNSSNNGIYLYYSSNNRISSNEASNNDCGIWIRQSSSSNEISDNSVVNNLYGIYLYYSDANMVFDNEASSNNLYGIYLYYSSNNRISSNEASDNDCGIYLYYSSNNNIMYHNNFVNNRDQAWTDSVNAWHRGNEGNYWSDYAGQDLDEDGIGDIPYVVGVNNQDDHPLMGTFSAFKVAWEGDAHRVTSISNSVISDFRFEMGRETGNKVIGFNVTGDAGTTGFSRVMIPTHLMNYSYIVVVDGEAIIATLIDTSNKTHAYIYFTYVHSSHTIQIISSKLLYLYTELLDEHVKLRMDFQNLNSTYWDLLDNHLALLGNYSQLLESYQDLTQNYSLLLGRYSTLNASQGNHTSLLLEHALNIRSLIYVFVATTAILIIATVYLSTHAHRRVSRATKS